MTVDEEEKKNDEEKDLELDLMAEAELLRLTRQIMEGDKEAYKDEAQKILRRQRKTLNDLEKEKQEVSRLLRMSKSARNNRMDAMKANKMAALAEEQEQLILAIDEEKIHLSDLEREIRRLEKQIGSQRLKMASGGRPQSCPAGRDRRDVSQKIQLLENRLDGVMINFNSTLAQNTIIRKEIDHLVGERSQFNDMISKLQKKIAGNKKTIADLTELAIQAYDQRDEAQSKIVAMKEKNDKDARNFTEEMKELQRTLDHDEKLKDFLFHKSNDRAFASDFGEDDKGKNKKLEEAKDKENVSKYKEAFEQIKNIVGTDASLEKITSDFVRIEDANFALFNYVTEMNNQVETLQDSILKLKQDIKEARERGEEKERQQQEKVRDMEKKLEDSEHEADKTETKLDLMESVLVKLKTGTEDLYIKCDCGSTPVLSLLGDAKEEPKRPFVNDNNIIMYLDMIHEKIVELKGVAQFIDFQEGKSSEAPDVKPLHKLKHKPGQKSEAGQHGVLGRAESKHEEDDIEVGLDQTKPLDVGLLKTRAFIVNTREKKEEETNASSKSRPKSGKKK
ncbi:coiled-coil domain-containing protein 63 [Eurytemora carolleeae]|uniref:coiled-coil domain-containing protein 63 n=1 Tax=Eurytemora carolleeae TaxID=1294199 RepID=UPI000C769E0E|nr:coiled-coil domain-containing protein 63 [Eurytemora carolleeae]|eukprot:XP_023338844.1 coiled-coil domain-containing protein 63-like [Eurytemora affinis]